MSSHSADVPAQVRAATPTAAWTAVRVRPARILGNVSAYAGYLAVLAWTLFPIAWLLVTSFKPAVLTLTMPPVWVFAPTLEGYRGLLESGEFPGLLWNTLVVSTITALVVLGASLPAAYAFSRFRFPWKGQSLFLILAIRALPPVAAVVPLFLLYQRAGLMDTYLGLVLLYSSFFVSFAVLMMKSFFDEVPVDLDEAAMIDGAGRFQAFRRVIFPLVAPGVAATAIFAFVSSWNEFFFAFVFTSRAAKTVPVGLAQFVGETGIAWSQLAAGSTAVMVPSLILIWLVQKHLVHGLAAGAVK